MSIQMIEEKCGKRRPGMWKNLSRFILYRVGIIFFYGQLYVIDQMSHSLHKPIKSTFWKILNFSVKVLGIVITSYIYNNFSE